MTNETKETKEKIDYPEGMYVVKKGRPNAPVAKVISQEDEKLLIEYLNGETFETYGINLDGEARYEAPKLPPYKSIVFNDPYTIVVWADGVKTMAKTTEGDEYCRLLGLVICYIKYTLGSLAPFAKAIANYDKGVADKEAKQKAKEEAKAEAKARAESEAAEKEAKKTAEKKQDEMYDMLLRYVAKNLAAEMKADEEVGEVDELPQY